MIPHDFFNRLPQDKLQALVLIDEAYRNNKTDESYEFWRSYVASVIAYCRKNQIELGEFGEVPLEQSDFYGWLANFKLRVEMAIRELQFSGGGSDGSYSSIVYLNSDYRQRLTEQVDKLRKIVFHLEIDERKKEAILSKLIALQAEINSRATKIDQIGGIFIDVSSYLGAGAQHLDPFMKFLGKVADLFGQVMEKNSSGEIPAPDETLKLEAPDADNDIPF